MGATEPLAFLNLGGVGNVTWVDPLRERPDEEGALLAFDTGPANAPVDDLMLRRRGLPRDDDGALAATGQVAEEVVERFLSNRFFTRRPPKSLDRDEFAALARAVEPLSDAHAAATLTACAARAVGAGMAHCPRAPSRLLVTGGGRRNATLMRTIAEAAGCPVEPVEAAGLDGDMLEAQAFAYLAVRVTRGLSISAPGTTGVARPSTGGRLDRPAEDARRRRS
jgi:anhydro-N-acetylmuramic acid kinase